MPRTTAATVARQRALTLRREAGRLARLLRTSAARQVMSRGERRRLRVFALTVAGAGAAVARRVTRGEVVPGWNRLLAGATAELRGLRRRIAAALA